jgi:hypothetical protein
MAKLPSERYLIQQSGGTVRLFENYTEALIAAFDPADGIAVQNALEAVRASDDLGDEDKCFACFWAGYFHAYADRNPEVPGEVFVTERAGIVTVATAGTEVVAFTAADGNAAARAQKRIYDCASLSQPEKDRAHFWSGFFYAQAC